MEEEEEVELGWVEEGSEEEEGDEEFCEAFDVDVSSLAESSASAANGSFPCAIRSRIRCASCSAISSFASSENDGGYFGLDGK